MTPDPVVAAWFKSLHSDSGFPCCDISDCRRVEEVKHDTTGYHVLLRGRDFAQNDTEIAAWHAYHPDDQAWVDVPDNKVVMRPDNPTGSAIACYSVYADVIYCFVPWETGG